MADGPTRWGIVSAGLISHDFVCALKLASNEKHVTRAIAARNLDRAEKFAKDHDIPTAYGSYQQLADDPNIDVVYVGSIPSSHYDVIKMLLTARKAVLSEKPAFINHKQACEIVELAKEKGVLFVEGMWSRFFPAYNKLRETLDSGELGEAQIVHFTMGFDYAQTDWVENEATDWRMDPKTGGGIGLAFGVYAVSLGEWVFKEAPTKIVATGDICRTIFDICASGCDTTCTFVLHYSNNRRLVCTVSSVCNLHQNAVISCKKGIIQLPVPWCPVKIQIKEEWFDYPIPKSDTKFNYVNCTGFLYEADHIRDLLKKGLLESPISSFDFTLSNIKTVDEIRRQMGVIFSQD